MEADERRMEAENQRKAKHYQAWQAINAAQGKSKDNFVPVLRLDFSREFL
jgi:hypothetical protein